MIPIAGSAYTYSYATMGEFVAWIIGWDLVLEYAVGAATVAIAWSEYANRVLGFVGMEIPYQFYHSPFETSADGVQGIINIPAVVILALLSGLLIRGIQESAWVNNFIVILKVSIVILVIVDRLGLHQSGQSHALHPGSHHLHHAAGRDAAYGGLMGILGAAGGGLLRVYRLRRRVDRRAGNQEPAAATCRLAFSARSRSAPSSTCCSHTC